MRPFVIMQLNHHHHRPPHASHTSKSHSTQHHPFVPRLNARPHPPSHVRPAAPVSLLCMACPAWHRGPLSPASASASSYASATLACLALPRKYGCTLTPLSMSASASSSAPTLQSEKPPSLWVWVRPCRAPRCRSYVRRRPPSARPRCRERCAPIDPGG